MQILAGARNLINKFGVANSSGNGGSLLSGSDSWRYGFPNPGYQPTQQYGARITQYDLGWQSYINSFFETYANLRYGSPIQNNNIPGGFGFFPWKPYNERRGLYRNTQPLYNPVRRLCDFYSGHVFPGVLSEDGSLLPDGVALAIPISRDATPELKAAISQGWNWGNWAQNKGLWIKFCAATGDGPVEIIDDVEEGIIYADPVWPGEITYVLIHRTKVVEYVREHRIIDEMGEQYVLFRHVTEDKIATYKDGAPFGVDGNPAEYDNPYGFCPLIWNQHVALKTMPGGQAVRSWNKIEKLNSLATRLNNYIVRQMKTPMLLPNFQNVKKVKIDASVEDELQILTSEGPGGIEKLEGNLEIEHAEARIAALLAEIEQDHPEVQVYNRLRELSQITGPAVEQLMGDVAGYLSDARTGYDDAEIRKDGMLVAIGGMRYKEGKGGWSKKTYQQAKFKNFDLDSIEKGDVEFAIDARPLMSASKLQQATAKMTVAQAYTAAEEAGFPLISQLKEEGWTEEQISGLEKDQDHQYEREMKQLKGTLAASNGIVDDTTKAEIDESKSPSALNPQDYPQSAPTVKGTPYRRLPTNKILDN